MTVTLSPLEVDLCRHLATSRTASNRANGVTNSRVGSQTNADTDLEGIGGEFAFCKLFNLFPDLSIHPRSAQAGEDFFDARIGDICIDVKTTRYSSGKLLAAPWKSAANPPHYYALMTGTCPTYTFRGVMTSEELLRQERLGSLGHGETYIAHQHELTPFPDLHSRLS